MQTDTRSATNLTHQDLRCAECGVVISCLEPITLADRICPCASETANRKVIPVLWPLQAFEVE